MTDINNEVTVYQATPLTAGEMRAHVNRVQEVMQAVMQRDTHYGTIPGSKKPSLYKPGAEVLCVTFRIAPSFQVEDLATPDSIRYRVTAVATHQTTGVVLGSGVGECSSNEEKYKWRRAICVEEYDDTPTDRRRIKYSKYQGKVERTQQIRTEPADIANTVLKMAVKRAQVAMTLNVTAASDCFTQDIEDLPEELREREDAASGAPAAPPPPAEWPADAFAAALAKNGPKITDGTRTADDLIGWMRAKAPLSATQEKAVRALTSAPKPIEGEVMAPEDQSEYGVLSEAEMAAARAKEMEDVKS